MLVLKKVTKNLEKFANAKSTAIQVCQPLKELESWPVLKKGEQSDQGQLKLVPQPPKPFTHVTQGGPDRRLDTGKEHDHCSRAF